MVVVLNDGVAVSDGSCMISCLLCDACFSVSCAFLLCVCAALFASVFVCSVVFVSWLLCVGDSYVLCVLN